tara:strand:+ start:26 stop:238 length:213 start_codon:yes stop_codon:yes gene_type:complete
MNKSLLKFIVAMVGIVIVYIYFFKEKFSEYNLEKSISACIVAQKRTADSFDLEKSKKYCEEEVKKQKQTN